ncbi:hypothetical protein MW344_005016 [Vibrio parahaemolyticus]|nr:hypothetical protein [Vibrio parahaemolyticus]
MNDNKLLSEIIEQEEHSFKDDTEKQIYSDLQHLCNRQDDKDFQLKQMKVMVLIMFMISVAQSVFFLKLFI